MIDSQIINIILPLGALLLSIISLFFSTYYSHLQKELAKKKREDDLFLLRWEAYTATANYFRGLVDELNSDTGGAKVFKNWLFNNHPQAIDIIFKCKCLFSTEISEHIKSCLSRERLMNVINEGRTSEGNWNPTLAFSKPFKKYLEVGPVLRTKA